MEEDSRNSKIISIDASKRNRDERLDKVMNQFSSSSSSSRSNNKSRQRYEDDDDDDIVAMMDRLNK